MALHRRGSSSICATGGCRYLTRHPSGRCPNHQEEPVRLHSKNLRTSVRTDESATRPVLLTFAGLTVAMTAAEAHELGDRLHDAAEEGRA